MLCSATTALSFPVKKENTEEVQKPVKKGKELRILDAKAGQNLCE